jgi:hypothetical protein
MYFKGHTKNEMQNLICKPLGNLTKKFSLFDVDVKVKMEASTFLKAP